MVEAVVNNGDPEGAYELIQEIRNDERCRDVLNSVIYCSVLKGFAREKKVDRAWAVYEEMCARKVELSIVTFNTLIDACARGGRMERVNGMVEDMSKKGIKPNIITYSTMLKGYCQMGDLQTAFDLLNTIKKEANLKPDEIMYNSLLDGCAQNGLTDQGLRLLDEMQREGITPSNFTLSVLIKMMSRARKLDVAFSLVSEISTKYKFRLNVHVYTNLAQACVSNRSMTKAMGIFEKMIKEKVQPESRIYGILVRASLSQGLYDQAAGLVRGALGLPGAPSFLATPRAVCYQLDHAVVNEALVGLANVKDLALTLLCDIREHKPRVRIDMTTQRRLMMTQGGPGSVDPAHGDSAVRRTRQGQQHARNSRAMA